MCALRDRHRRASLYESEGHRPRLAPPGAALAEVPDRGAATRFHRRGRLARPESTGRSKAARNLSPRERPSSDGADPFLRRPGRADEGGTNVNEQQQRSSGSPHDGRGVVGARSGGLQIRARHQQGGGVGPPPPAREENEMRPPDGQHSSRRTDPEGPNAPWGEQEVPMPSPNMTRRPAANPQPDTRDDDGYNYCHGQGDLEAT